MYTSTPLPMIDTLNNHEGFIFILLVWVFCTIVILVVTYCVDHTDKDLYGAIKFCIWLFLPVLVAGIVSFNTGEIKKFKNIPVAMNFVEFRPEGYNAEVRSGKHTRRADVHQLYVVYEYNGSYVIITANANQVYPRQAVFYYN